MLFHSSIRKELARTFGTTFVVLVSIVISMMLIRAVRLAARGSVTVSYTHLTLPTILLV